MAVKKSGTYPFLLHRNGAVVAVTQPARA